MSSVRPLAGYAKKVMALSLCVFTAAMVSEVLGFDFSRYRPRMIQELIKDFEPQKGLAITQDIPIRSKAIYSGEFRDLSADSRRLIAVWAESMNVPGAPQAFHRELKIVEAGHEYWVPVQEVLVPTMKAELRPVEEIELFMIYIGQVDGHHVLLVNAFDHEGPHRSPP